MLRLILKFILFIYYFNFVYSKSPSVIIIGAGPAGIAAAAKLLENSISNITIFEAENRIGGRVYSVEFGEGFVDIGAEYCHGEEGNIVYQTVKDLNVLEHTYLFTQETVKVYNSQGVKINANLSKDLHEFLENYVFDVVLENSTKSIGDVALETYNHTILDKYKNNKNDLETALNALTLMENLISMHEGTFNWFQPSAAQHYRVCPGDQQITWKTGGYNTILQVLTKSYPDPAKKLPIDNKIHLNKKVTKIFWDDHTAKVQLQDSTTLEADHVIFTPSVGVLKAQKDTLFEPKLPQEKLNALEAIGFSGVMKVILHFPEKWWKNETESFEFLWNREDLNNIKNDFSLGPEQNGISWVASVTALVKVPSNENVFVAWIASEILVELEKADEDIVLKGCNFVIKKFLGKDYKIVEADKIIRSQWITNPNFLGTYSYERAGFSKSVSYQNELAKSLTNSDGKSTLLFAGEATHPTVYSTVHGAIETGRREANKIIDIHKNI